MRAFKNPCDGSFKEKLGNLYPYCYLLQYAKQLSIAINKDQCSCNVLQTCKAKLVVASISKITICMFLIVQEHYVMHVNYLDNTTFYVIK